MSQDHPTIVTRPSDHCYKTIRPLLLFHNMLHASFDYIDECCVDEVAISLIDELFEL